MLKKQINVTDGVGLADYLDRMSVRSHWIGLLVGCLFYLTVAILTMPRYSYPGDNFVPRAEAIYLAKHGDFGIPRERAKNYGGAGIPRGQYYFENDAKNMLYSKYGIAYTVAYLPPILIELAVNPDFDFGRADRGYFFKQSIYLIFLGVIFVFYLYRFVSIFSNSQLLCTFFTLISIYSTFLWYYLRAPALEIFQLPAFIGACFHGLFFLHRLMLGDNSKSNWMNLLFSTLWSGSLVLMKSSYVFLGFAISVFPFFVDPIEPSCWKRPFVSLFKNIKQYSWALIIPWLIIFAILLTFNYIKFGDVFDSGYMQWLAADGTPKTKFGMSYFSANFMKIFVRIPNDFNIFKLYPYALLGILSLYPFFRKRLVDGLFILAVTVPGVFLLLIYNMADGQWCYGPRYFLFYAIMFSFPFVWVCDFYVSKVNIVYKSSLLICCMIPVLYLSWVQFIINSSHYFANYYLNDYFRQTKQPSLVAYTKRGRWNFYKDLFYYRQGWGSYYPLDVIRSLIPLENQSAWMAIKNTVDFHARPNFYFFNNNKKAVVNE